MTWRRTALFAAFTFAVLIASAVLRPAQAQFADMQEPATVATADAAGGDAAAIMLSPEELHALVAPVAFYPDDLLAIVLPAATQPLQVVEAARFLEKQKASKELQPNENWDPAVLALLNYPEVIKLMNDDLDWTQRLGNAVMDQQEGVLEAIQAARAEATAAGALKSDDKQTVVTESETIIIQPADPEIIYVPTYDPAPVVEHHYTNYPPPVYSTPYPYYYAPGAAFVTGMFVGAAFSYAFDWNNNNIDIDCCDGGGNTNNINIGNGNTNIDRDKLQNKFNGDRNPKAKGGNGMKWSPQKARTKSTATRPANAKPRPNSAGIANQLGGGGAGPKKMTPPKAKPSAQTRQQSNRGNQSLGANKQQRQQQFKQPSKPKPSQMQQRRQQQKYNSMQTKPRKGSFSTMPSQQRARQQSNRGTSSIGGVKGPSRSRSGGGRR
ncbi:DUF3300 domain-containing protein [Dongia sp.]|uniref:DUF3300 domain-containing protein n=1 Tax=Dongia sp. TaxID=1977262 RepID=UPI003752FFF3